MRVSVILPSLRPDFALASIDALRPQLADIAHEFVVACPHPVVGPQVLWVPEARPMGSVAATQAAFAASSGDILVGAGDDIRFDPGAMGEALAAFAAVQRPFPMGLAYPSRIAGVATHFCLYGHLCPAFFAIGRADAQAAGGFVDTAFRLAYADPDLGLRVWAAGGQMRAAKATVAHRFDDASKGDGSAAKDAKAAVDFELFRARWAGAFDPAWGDNVGGLKHLVAVEAAGLLGPDAGTIAVVDRDGMRDIRILHAITVSAISHNAPLPKDVLAAGLEYMRWVAGLGPDPSQVEIRDAHAVALVRGFGGRG
jgi:hypothetical protein